MNSALCDIGCDEYGYPILPPSPSFPMAEGIISRAEFWRGVAEGYRDLIAASRQPLSASWHHLACITAPPPRTMPARALAYRTQKIGIR